MMVLIGLSSGAATRREKSLPPRDDGGADEAAATAVPLAVLGEKSAIGVRLLGTLEPSIWDAR